MSLTWHAPVPASAFLSFEVYQATEANPSAFQLLSTITDHGSTTFLHTGTTANQQSNLYFIVTRQNGLPDITSDTLRTIHLTVDNTDPYLALLNWNAMHLPLLPASGADYDVFSHNPSTSFALAGTTQELQLEVPVLVCWDTLYFRVETEDDSGCVSRSNIFSAVFRDTEPPPIPVLDSVSIDPYTGEVLLGWNESPAEDAGGYVIYNVLPTINDTLAFVTGREITDYIDTSFDPCLENRSYALAARDTCWNISPGSYAIPQRTILLGEVDFDPCKLENHLGWSAYINMSPPLAGYRIYLSQNGGPFEVLAILNAETTGYTHQGLVPGSSYNYFVRAFSEGEMVTSTSCFRELTTWQYRQPFENAMANASVYQDESVELTLWPDTFAFVPTVLLYRATEPGGPWELLDSIDLAGEEVVYYDDPAAEVDLQSYYYRSSLIDSCGNEVLTSDWCRTILLEGAKLGDSRNELIWNAFEGWPAGVAEYRIYRAYDDESFILAGSVGGTTLSYIDDAGVLQGEFSRLRYLVEAVDGGPDDRNSFSNSIILDYQPVIFLPNAFRPGGYNPEFRPVGTFALFAEYRMEVFNRWGEMIFSTDDFGRGWDGLYKGSEAPPGVYVCLVSYRSTTGEAVTLKSTFVLIR